MWTLPSLFGILPPRFTLVPVRPFHPPLSSLLALLPPPCLSLSILFSSSLITALSCYLHALFFLFLPGIDAHFLPRCLCVSITFASNADTEENYT